MKRIKKTSFWKGEYYICAYCTTEVGYLDGFCGKCGLPIEWERCPRCGQISESMKGDFCIYCGTAPLRR